MVNSVGSDSSRTAAYRLHLTQAMQTRQRWMILVGGALYALACVWASLRIGSSLEFSRASLALLPVTLLLYGLTHAKHQPGPLLEINPSLFAGAFGYNIILGAAAAPDGAATRFALLFGVLSFFTVMIAPTLRATLAAWMVTALTAALGAFWYLPAHGITPFEAIEAASYTALTLAMSAIVAFGLETQRSEAFALKTELERRATSDNLTGVSNRAHISQLAQNEFARAATASRLPA